MTAPNPDAFLTIAAAAADLGVHPDTVAKAIREGRLPGVILGGGRNTIYRIPTEAWAKVKAGLWRAPVTTPPAKVGLVRRLDKTG